MGAKSEKEIITISIYFRFVSYDNDWGILNVSLLELDFCLKYLTVFRLVLCLNVLNVAFVINSCLLMHIFDG